MTARADVVVIGAGITGASIGYHLLASDPSLRVVILETEDRPGTGATARATGGVRFQFATEAHIRLSLLSRPYFLEFKERFGIDPGFRTHGYLFVTADPARWAAMGDEARLQRLLGVPTERLDPPALQELCPPLETADLMGGQFCPWDGSVDPHSVMEGFLSAFRRCGGELRLRAPVTDLERLSGAWRVQTPVGVVEAAVVVVAAGGHSHQVTALAGLDIPARPYRRQVFIMAAHPALPPSLPLTVDLDTGWYLHVHRGGALLMGGTDKDSNPGLDPVVDWSGFDRVAEAAARRMPVVVESRLMRAMAGVRMITPDHHPILGPSGVPGLYLACGFSGHGIMHSPAVGLLLAEWILYGAPCTWDAGALTLDRFRQGALISEKAVF